MKVAMVVNAYHPFIGGVETHVRRLVAGLTAAGEDVEVITPASVGAPTGVDTVDGVRVRRFPLTTSAANYRFSGAQWRWLAGEAKRYDLLHAHSYHALPSLGAALTSRVPLVFTAHYHGTGHSPIRAALHRVYRPVGQRILARASRVLCVSGAERDLLVQHFPQAAGRTTVIPNGVEPAPLHAAAARVGSTAAGNLFVVGRLEEYKRVDRVIAALPHLTDDVRLVVVGTGPDHDRLTRLASDLAVAGRVTFAGRLDFDALQEAFIHAAAVVSLSRLEAFGMTVADALTAGVPVVASDIAAHREVAVLAGPAAWIRLVDPQEPAALTAALVEALAAVRRPIGTTTLPTWDDVVAQTRRVYSEVMAAPTGRMW